TKGKAKMGRYALEATAQILKYYNDYFGAAYPLPKLDQIALPGGFGGAMENWGGITYFESALLFDPKNSSAETKQNIYEVLANEAEANSAFDDITYKKGQSFLRMLESFLGKDIFREGIRRYIAKHKYSNSTTADLWNALSEASRKPVGEIAAGWTEQSGFPV